MRISNPNNLDLSKLPERMVKYIEDHDIEILTVDANNNVNCKDCKNCKGCIGCEGCIWCKECKACKGCIGCEWCEGCKGCIGCEGCTAYKNSINKKEVQDAH